MKRWLLALLCVLLLPTAASAHLLPKQTATMRIKDDAAFLVVSVPISALKNVDDDENGMLSLAEIERHNQDIARQFEAGFHVSDEAAIGSGVLTMVMSPVTDGETDESDYVVVLQRINFNATPQQPSIHTTLFGTGAGENQIRIKASRGEEVEVAIVGADNPGHIFFRGGLAVFSDFIGTGFEHIWSGADHLLFLLTIIIVGASWRHWMLVITGFTIAHSITLALSVLNIVRIPSTIAETGIALSIVIMAALNLRGYASGKAAHGTGWPRVAIVFACGLLHGFGFASAIGSAAINAGNRAATIAGFNIGIELGQLLFVGLVLALLALVRKLSFAKLADVLPPAASLFAFCMGLYWLAQRTGAL